MDGQIISGGGAGSASGPGRVYTMQYTQVNTGNTYYKIGCTSRDVNVRLNEIQRSEGNNGITLVGSIKANEMNGAETAGQQAVKAKGLVKDPARGGATDWFMGSSTPQQVFGAVRPAVYRHNAKNKK